MLQMGSWSGVVVLPAFALSLGFGESPFERHVAGAPKHPDGVICCCYDFCSPNIYEDLGHWPTQTHSSWDASGSIFIQARTQLIEGRWMLCLMSAGRVSCFRGWFLALLASPAYRQWAMQPFHLQRKRTLFFCLFFLEDDVDLYRQTVFLRFLARSFPVSSFEITGSKLYRSFWVPCLPWAHVPPLKKKDWPWAHRQVPQ